MRSDRVELNAPFTVPRGLAGACDEQKSKAPHVSVCVCTYKRPRLLERLLNSLDSQETNGLFTFSAIVADNDRLRSAEPVVQNFMAKSSIPVRYCLEVVQSIALTRNKAIENAEGEFVAFIDDDEFPVNRWLLTLFQVCNEYNVDGVLGPVKRHFDEQPPEWIIKGNFYERPVYPTGLVVDWRTGRTGNVLLKRAIFEAGRKAFKKEFIGGEDTDFFRRMIQRGHTFIWSSEAVAFEVIPCARWKRSYMLKKALLRGAMTLLNPKFGASEVVRSVLAVPAYTVALPFALLVGQHKFMDLLVRLFDHLGKLLAFAGVNRVKDRYVIE